MKKLTVVSFAVAMFAILPSAGAQTPDEKTAIRQAALDYLEGWYQGDAARMDRALHKELMKRAIFGAGNAEQFVNLTKPQMVEATEKGGGKNRPAPTRNIKVEVLDVYHNIATVRTECADYIDYLHLAKSEGQWKIINVLWQNVVTEHKQIAVDPKVLADYAGEYQLKPGVIIAITVENDQIFAQASGKPKMQVYPYSMTDFFVKGVPVEITFVKDRNGRVTRLVIRETGNELIATRTM